MCCVVALGALVGPRVAIAAWWLLDPIRWSIVFGNPFWPFLGFVFLPWTTLVYVFVTPGGFGGLGLVWLLLALVVDLSSYGGGVRSRRW